MSEVIYGKNSLLEALRSNPSGDTFNEVLLLKDDKDVTSLCLKNKVKYTILGKDKFNNILRDKKIDNVNHQGCIGIIKGYEYYNLNDLLTDDGDLIIALDGLEDPHNLGAIIRTCEISGASGIILPKNRSVRVTPTVEKVSTGATRYVKVAQVTNLVSSLKELKRQGYWIVGAEASEKSVNYWSPDYKRKICLVIGSEGKGVSRLVKEECDYLVEIPMWGRVNSLNASVACGILVYEIRRQQRNN